jgi:hypothetical protein
MIRKTILMAVVLFACQVAVAGESSRPAPQDDPEKNTPMKERKRRTGEDLPDLNKPAPFVPPIPQGVPLPEFGGQTEERPAQPRQLDTGFSPQGVMTVVVLGVVGILWLYRMVRQEKPRG